MGWYYKEPKLTKCPGCGTEFWRAKWSDKRYCDPLCTGARLTDYDKKVLADYRALCTRYSLAAHKTFEQITGHPWRYFYYLTQRLEKRKKTAKNRRKDKYTRGRYSTATKDRYIAVIKRIVDDIHAGKYAVVLDRISLNAVTRSLMRKNRLVRRLSPGRPECPMKLVHCAGGLYPGDCPRHWRECPLWSN
jgi:hypothetical protein